MPVAATLVAVLAALALAGYASALTCPNVPLEERIAGADGAFVGRIAERRAAAPDGSEARFVYRFLVDQKVKGPLGREIDVRAALLVDANDHPLPLDTAVGVLLAREGAAWSTGSCNVTDPGALLSTADEPRGNSIKIVVGVLILAVVLIYSYRRLGRRSRQGEHPRSER